MYLNSTKFLALARSLQKIENEGGSFNLIVYRNWRTAQQAEHEIRKSVALRLFSASQS